MRRVGNLLCCFLLSSGTTLAQAVPAKAAAGGQPTAMLQTSARMVLLDVLVTDKSGKPVHGLKAQDFMVLEDGKPQQVQGFEEHRRDAEPARPSVAVNLPANTYTNYVTNHEPGAVNIVLFDSLHTDRQNLAIARQQLLLYLSKLPDSARVALFTLDGSLHLVHGFTQDSHELIEAAQQLSSYPHPAMRKARDVTEDLAEARMVHLNDNPQMYQALSLFLWKEYDSKSESRMLITMEALNQLARSIAVFPGRKNLIWISGGVPFDPGEHHAADAEDCVIAGGNGDGGVSR